MLKHSVLRIACASLGALLLLLIVAWLWGPPSQICKYNQSTHQNPCQTYNFAFFIIIKIGEVLNYYGPLITALATVAIACFTFELKQSNDRLGRLTKEMSDTQERQMLVAGSQADIQLKQHAIGRLQFFATHRPRLRVRHVSVVTADHIGHPTLFFNHGAQVKGALIVVNVGGSEAKTVDTRYRIFFTKTGLPASAPYDDDFRTDLLLPGQVLKVGESVATPIEDTIDMNGGGSPEGEIFLRAFDAEDWVIYVMGQIRYQDEAGADRFMGFCRKRGGDGRFSAVDDPDYEYED